MTLSRIAQSIRESPTLKLNEIAARLRAAGEPVIHLGGGEPKSRPPQAAIDAAIKLLNTGEIRYGPADGIPALKQAVIAYTERFYARGVQPGNVIISAGAKQAIMVALQAILNTGDEVIYPVPYWVSYPEMVKLAGGAPVEVKPADGTLQPTVADIESHVTPRAKIVILNSPNNPSGVMYSAEFIAGVVQLCRQRDLWLVMDDIYHRLIFDGRKPVSACDFERDRTGGGMNGSHLILVNGVSKQYAMTGYRIGWAVADASLIAAMSTIQSQQTSGPSVLNQQAAVGALSGDQSSVDDLRGALENNRNLLLEHLRQIPGISAPTPDGTFYCLADFRRHDPSSASMARTLLDRVRVVTVPGVEFGAEGCLRLSYCGSKEDIVEGLRRIRWALDPSGPRDYRAGSLTFTRNWT